MIRTLNNAQIRLTRTEFELLKAHAACEGFFVTEPPTTPEGILQLILMGMSDENLDLLRAATEARLEEECASCGA